jgi:hypothetical protein
VSRAVECGLVMQEDLEAVNRATGVTLRRRIAVNAGAVSFCIVRGPARARLPLGDGAAVAATTASQLLRRHPPVTCYLTFVLVGVAAVWLARWQDADGPLHKVRLRWRARQAVGMVAGFGRRCAPHALGVHGSGPQAERRRARAQATFARLGVQPLP